MKWYYYLVLSLPMMVAVASISYSIFAEGTAIIEATILSVSEHPTIWAKYLFNVNATKAYPNAPFSVQSQCYHSPSEHIYIGISVSSQFNGYHPRNANATLFKEQGIGFVGWDGC